MNEQIKELAAKAGFVLWEDEEWNPGSVIDWSSEYDQQLEQFAKLLIEQAIQAVEFKTNTHHAHTTFDLDLIRTTIGNSVSAIRKQFGMDQ